MHALQLSFACGCHDTLASWVLASSDEFHIVVGSAMRSKE
jgi:hypothetical protein